MEPFMKLAVLNTVDDAGKLLLDMRAGATAEQQKRVDEMVARLTTMAAALTGAKL